MKFFAIDLETTGLVSTLHGVTEFACVYADLESSSQPKTFYRWVNPEGYVWSNYCLMLHSNWIREVTYRLQHDQWHGSVIICKDMMDLWSQFQQWLVEECGWIPLKPNGDFNKITAAGKNFGSFDSRFLEAAKWPGVFRHRALDPTLAYTHKDDIFPPELKLCKERAMADGAKFKQAEVMHNAVEDAMDVVDLLQFAFRNK